MVIIHMTFILCSITLIFNFNYILDQLATFLLGEAKLEQYLEEHRKLTSYFPFLIILLIFFLHIKTFLF